MSVTQTPIVIIQHLALIRNVLIHVIMQLSAALEQCVKFLITKQFAHVLPIQLVIQKSNVNALNAMTIINVHLKINALIINV